MAQIFSEASDSKYCVYIHSQIEQLSINDKNNLDFSFPKGYHIISHLQTAWGTSSLVQAELLLYKQAFKDEKVNCCVLMSENCVPLQKFNTFYEKIIDKNMIGYIC